MSAVDEFLNMTEGFILDSDYEMLQYNVLLEIIERVKALEDWASDHAGPGGYKQICSNCGKHHWRPDCPELKPAPAPDLERIIDKYILWVNTNPRDALRAFAAELGVSDVR